MAGLQRRLDTLGFDGGRVDGIFGPHTATALSDFQRNAGLTSDAICGPATIAALERLAARTSEGSVAGVRERDALLHAPRTLDGRHIVVGEWGGLDALAGAVGRALNDIGAVAVSLSDPDDSRQASEANAFGADLYLGLAATDVTCTAAFYATQGFESSGGRLLAGLLAREFDTLFSPGHVHVRGMTVPILRETRMPAVLCELGPPTFLVEQGPAVAQSVVRAVAAWTEAPQEA